MKTVSKITRATALTLLFSASGLAAGPDAGKAPPLQPQPRHAGECMRPAPNFLPPPRVPLYEASLQSRQPDQALGKLIANAPQGEEGRNYEVSVLVRELPPEPAAPEKAAK